ncbi:MAG TPA: Ig-like domain-containing protein [Gemmatimonadales bacterium]|nr:Ig-like domain-containing protein [Gemmatimonadales bacterium]
MVSKIAWVLAAAALAALPGCASDELAAGEVLVVSQVEVTPPGAGLRVGGTQQLTAVPKTASGIPVPNRPVDWSSADPGIATVSEAGMVTAVGLGSTDIMARVDQATGRAEVNVSRTPVGQVVVQPASFTLEMGETRQLAVSVRSDDGEALTGRTVTFVSDNAAIATVSSAGVVTAIGAGQTVIRARSEGKEARSDVTVLARPAVRLAFATQPADAAAGATLAPIRVAVQDEVGSTVTTSTASVTMSLDRNPGGATLSGTRTVTASGGVATFSNLRIDKAGSGYTLRATSGSLSPTISNQFDITGNNGGDDDDDGGTSATVLVITTQPSGDAKSGDKFKRQPVVQLRDASGDDISDAGVAVTASLVGSGGKLGGKVTVSTNDKGEARYSDLRITGTGTFRIRFSASGLTAVTSSEITVKE